MNNGSHINGSITSYGSYYTFRSATAGTGGSTITSTNLIYDVCPHNWTLPILTQFQTLISKIGSTKSAFDSAWHTVFAGGCWVGSCKSVPTTAYWNTRTAGSSSSTHGYLYSTYNGSTYAAVNAANRFDAISNRCLAK